MPIENLDSGAKTLTTHASLMQAKRRTAKTCHGVVFESHKKNGADLVESRLNIDPTTVYSMMERHNR